MSSKAKRSKMTQAIETVAAVTNAVEVAAAGGVTTTPDVATPAPELTVTPISVMGVAADAENGPSVTVVQHATTNKLQVYRDLSSKQFDVEVSEGDKVGVPNKRALVCALYVLVCDALQVSVKAHNDHAIKLVARLLPYANAGYSKQKQRILSGNEVTTSGMLAYARFVRKPDAAKLLPGGELHERCKGNTAKLAQYIFNTYSGVEGIDAAKVTVQHTSK